MCEHVGQVRDTEGEKEREIDRHRRREREVDKYAERGTRKESEDKLKNKDYSYDLSFLIKLFLVHLAMHLDTSSVFYPSTDTLAQANPAACVTICVALHSLAPLRPSMLQALQRD